MAFSGNKLNMAVDLRLVVLVLLGIIIVMLFTWKPWQAGTEGGRTVEARGEATISATPDEFAFYPSYEFKSADKDMALADLSKKSEELVAALKKIGVAEAKIKTNSNGYDFPVYLNDDSKETTYMLQLTVTVGTKELAQKVQDYLVTTTPTGSVSPQATFSDKKQKELKAQARDEATKDARRQAEQMADNLGFKIGKVKNVSEEDGFGGAMPLLERGAALDAKASTSLAVQPGENELRYSVSVTYFIR